MSDPTVYRVRLSEPGLKRDVYVTREEFPEWHEEIRSEQAAAAAAAEAEADAERTDRARLTQLLADVETGTSAQAIAALRVLVPRLARRDLG
jgi:hypothetical protein